MKDDGRLSVAPQQLLGVARLGLQGQGTRGHVAVPHSLKGSRRRAAVERVGGGKPETRWCIEVMVALLW